MEPIAVVGLGNPGTEYGQMRHNVGFQVLDTLSGRWKKGFKPGKGEYYFVRAAIGDREVILVKPLTFMNNSGEAVAEVIDRFSLPFSSLLVVADDFALPLGVLRLRPSGSDGGHNGLSSIIYQLQSDQFPRLRCGIGRAEMPPPSAMADFVLSAFEPEEQASVRSMVGRAADAVTHFVSAGIESAMNVFNRQ